MSRILSTIQILCFILSSILCLVQCLIIWTCRIISQIRSLVLGQSVIYSLVLSRIHWGIVQRNSTILIRVILSNIALTGLISLIKWITAVLSVIQGLSHVISHILGWISWCLILNLSTIVLCAICLIQRSLISQCFIACLIQGRIWRLSCIDCCLILCHILCHISGLSGIFSCIACSVLSSILGAVLICYILCDISLSRVSLIRDCLIGLGLIICLINGIICWLSSVKISRILSRIRCRILCIVRWLSSILCRIPLCHVRGCILRSILCHILSRICTCRIWSLIIRLLSSVLSTVCLICLRCIICLISCAVLCRVISLICTLSSILSAIWRSCSILGVISGLCCVLSGILLSLVRSLIRAWCLIGLSLVRISCSIRHIRRFSLISSVLRSSSILR